MGVVREKARSALTIHGIMADVREAYLGDARPWVVGFSGGKDSTMVAQLVYYMLANLPPRDRHKQVHFLASDTRMWSQRCMPRARRAPAKAARLTMRRGLPVCEHRHRA